MAFQQAGVMADHAASSLLMLSSMSALAAPGVPNQLNPSRNFLHEPLPAVTGLIHKKEKPKTYHKVAKDFRCQWCGTSNTPEMRPGPAGKNTLCNRFLTSPTGADYGIDVLNAQLNGPQRLKSQ